MVDINLGSTETEVLDLGAGSSLTSSDFESASAYVGAVYDFDFGAGVFVYSVLRGTDNVFTSIWCDPDASISSCRLYITTSGTLHVIKTENGNTVIEDYYDSVNGGRADEVLKSDDIIDIGYSSM
jgi:hypothetical protein